MVFNVLLMEYINNNVVMISLYVLMVVILLELVINCSIYCWIILLVVGRKLVKIKWCNWMLMLENMGKVVKSVKIMVISGINESNDI